MTIQSTDRAAETRHKLIHGGSLHECDWCPLCGAEIRSEWNEFLGEEEWTCLWCGWFW